MSGFEDNPFADPSIRSATAGSATLEEYNPFEDPHKEQRTQSQRTTPAVMSPTSVDPPKPQITTAELQRRQEELERKSRELDRREAELNNQPFNARSNNWPPLPSFIPIQPCFYQDIQVDIPVEFQRIVRYLYYIWLLNALCLIANLVTWALRMICFAEFGGFFTSIVLVIVLIPASYLCWWRPAYKAFRTDSSFNFMVFFFVFFFQFLVSFAFCTVVPGANGLVGGIQMILDLTPSKVVVGIFATLCGLGFAVSAVLELMMLIRVHRVYRSTGASFEKAKQEFASGVIRNEHVQSAATGLAGEVVRQQMSQAAAGTGSRY